MLHMFFLTLLIASQPAISSTPTDLQLQRLVKSIGMYEQLAEQMRVLEQQTESTARQLTENATAPFPTLPVGMEEEFEKEMETFMRDMHHLMDMGLVADAYIAQLKPRLSAEDVDQLIAFYESPIGRKFTQVNTEVSGPVLESFMTDFNQKLGLYLQVFSSKLNRISEKYGATRHKHIKKPPCQAAGTSA